MGYIKRESPLKPYSNPSNIEKPKVVMGNGVREDDKPKISSQNKPQVQPNSGYNSYYKQSANASSVSGVINDKNKVISLSYERRFSSS